MPLKKRQIALLILPMLLGCLIFASWLRCQERYINPRNLPALRYKQASDCVWERIDSSAFRLLNGTMRDNRPMQILWGLTNHRACDLAAALWMISIFLIYYLRNPRNEDRVELIQFAAYMSLFTLAALTLAEIGLGFRRDSPTLVPGLKENAIFLTRLEHITWKLKDSSSGSFPGDHGLVLMMTGSYLLYRLRSLPLRIAVVFGAVFFSLPRLAGGGHWLSDILVGSTLYYSVLFPLSMFEPVRRRGLTLLRKPAEKIHGITEWMLRKTPFGR